MLLSLILLLLLLAIAYFQATLGFFSALIMAVLTICCSAAALGTHEWVAIHWLAPFWKPNFACAIALGATFGIPLIIVRVVTDKFIRRSCLLPSMIDRIGAGVCGVITALVLVGTMALAVQMVPFSYTFLGYSRIAVPKKEDPKDGGEKPTAPVITADERDLWAKPDRFAVGFASALSAGTFSGERLLSEDYPDFVQAVGWNNATDAEISRFVPPRSIGIVRTAPLSFVYHYKAGNERSGEPAVYEPRTPSPGKEFRMIRVELRRGARDENKYYSFTLRQFRLVGRVEGDDVNEQYFPIAIQQEDATQSANRHIRTKHTTWGEWHVVDDPVEPRDDNNNEVEIVFELPERFKPSFLEYKRCTRVRVTFESEGTTTEANVPPAPTQQVATTEPTAPPASVSPPPPAEPEPERRPARGTRGEGNVPDSGRGGRVRGLTTQVGQSHFGDDIPMTLRAYQALRDASFSRQGMDNGHLVGYVDEQESGSGRAVRKFDVPPEKRLLHLNVGRLHARSGLGQALDFAATTVQNYVVEDSNGQRYQIVGKYAIANVEGRQVIEVQYFPNQAGSIGGLGQFNKIQDQHLKDDYELVLLFLVDPGATIVSFSTGGAATRADDLREENLVAPQ